jgi:hypothetical protein
MGDAGGNVWRSKTFREAVALTMALGGLEGAKALPIKPRPKLSEVMLLDEQPGERSHITGIPNWAFGVHADVRQHRLGPHVDAAEQAANLTGADHYAVVAYRSNRSTADALAVMPLTQLVDLIRTTQEREPVS